VPELQLPDAPVVVFCMFVMYQFHLCIFLMIMIMTTAGKMRVVGIAIGIGLTGERQN
jgi:hypothetical protein